MVMLCAGGDWLALCLIRALLGGEVFVTHRLSVFFFF